MALRRSLPDQTRISDPVILRLFYHIPVWSFKE
nr:MAG TPA: hypothetical protein [Caudoviricetes sp.]DAS40127.1 MAG TPA: hypothetical protein [Caudoviricetes sp.]